MIQITKDQVENKLLEVMDPELYMSIVDLGLIYDIDIQEEKVTVHMTLTTLGCPLFDTIEEDVKTKVGELGIDEDKVTIKLTFDPPWTMDRMSERGKAMMGI
ncbi:MAG: metal-sulfur cluster assembly factor [Weeksellaceae bacterium]